MKTEITQCVYQNNTQKVLRGGPIFARDIKEIDKEKRDIPLISEEEAKEFGQIRKLTYPLWALLEVTLRERDSTSQVRANIDDIVGACTNVVQEKQSWDDIVTKLGLLKI